MFSRLTLMSILTFIMGSWFLYQITIQDNYVEIEGILKSKEIVDIYKENSDSIVERKDLYLSLSGHSNSYLFRTYDQNETHRIYNRVKSGDDLKLIIYTEINQVWGISVNDVMILSVSRSQSLQKEKIWYMFVMGTILGVASIIVYAKRANKSSKRDAVTGAELAPL